MVNDRESKTTKMYTKIFYTDCDFSEMSNKRKTLNFSIKSILMYFLH